MLSQAERAYHLRQYEAPYRSTVILRDFIGPMSGSVLDVGCGAGANLFWLNRVWGISGGGIDADAELVAIARDRNPHMSFTVADFLDPLPRADNVLSIQVLSFIEDWRPALARLLEAAGRLFVTSLFWDGVSTHTHATDEGHTDAHYNVIEAQEFEFMCSPRAVVWRIPHDRLGWYMEEQREFSGPLYLPWRIAMVR